MSETAPLVPDANGMLANGLHQPTIEIMQAACITTAMAQDRKIQRLLREDDVTPERFLSEGWALACLYALIEKLTDNIGAQTSEKDIKALQAEYPELFGYWHRTLNEKRAVAAEHEAANLTDLEVN